MKKCPSCDHKLYGEDGEKRNCKFCGYNNDPNYHKQEENGDTSNE